MTHDGIQHTKIVIVDGERYEFEMGWYPNSIPQANGACFGLAKKSQSRWRERYPDETQEEWEAICDKISDTLGFTSAKNIAFENISVEDRIIKVEAFWSKLKHKSIKTTYKL